jgi:hypothetical protein
MNHRNSLVNKNTMLVRELPHLKPSQIHSALAYYFDHQDEVDMDLDESSDMKFWKSQIVLRPDQKVPNV